MKTIKCECCKTKIKHGYIRCHSCNKAWQEGRKTGIQELKNEILKIKNNILNFN